MGYNKYGTEHKDYITKKLIIEALSRFDYPNHRSSYPNHPGNICYDISEMIENIQKWIKEDLKIIIEIKNVNVYGHKRYYGILYETQEKFDNRFADFDINKEIKPNGIEFKTTNKNNGKEILFQSEEQLIFAIFEYVLDELI
jgi:hypothetical protein